MVAQAIPSVAPSNAAAHLKKLECFCFEQQELAPGEEALLPVRLIFDDELPSSINSVVLSYTIFDVTDYNDVEFTQHHNEITMLVMIWSPQYELIRNTMFLRK